MALNRYISDLEAGDVFRPVTYTVTPFLAREYCHGVEEADEVFHAATGEAVAPPTLVHIDKVRLLHANCPEGAGPTARLHYMYHARHHAPVVVGQAVVISGSVTKRYEKRGRTYLDMELSLHSETSGELLTSYQDSTVLSFKESEPQ